MRILVRYRFLPLYIVFSTVFIGGMKSVEQSASIDTGKLFRAALLMLSFVVLGGFFLFKYRKNLISREASPLYIYFSVCLFSSIYSDNFIYPFSKSVESIAALLSVMFLLSSKDDLGLVARNASSLVFRVSFLVLASSIFINIISYGVPFGYFHTSTTIGASSLMVLLSMSYSKSFVSSSLFLFCLVSLFFSYSRTNLGIALIVFPVFLVLTQRISLGFCLAIAIPFGTLFLVLFSGHILRGDDLELILSLTGRLGHWAHAISLIEDSPWLGYGYYYGVRVHASATYDAYKGYEFSSLDNNYLDSLVSVGLIGSAFLFYFIVKVLLLGWRLVGFARKHKFYVDALAGFYCVFLVCVLRAMMAPVFVFFHWNQFVMFGSGIALLIIYSKIFKGGLPFNIKSGF